MMNIIILWSACNREVYYTIVPVVFRARNVAVFLFMHTWAHNRCGLIAYQHLFQHSSLGPWRGIVIYQTLLSLAHAFTRARIFCEGSGHQTRSGREKQRAGRGAWYVHACSHC